jgi:hypothetical protein
MRCSYGVLGMILLHDLKGVAQFDCTKNMSVHVSISTSYDFDTLMPVVRSSGEDKTFLLSHCKNKSSVFKANNQH